MIHHAVMLNLHQPAGNLEHLLDEYYQSMGYSSEGIPCVKRLQALDLQAAIEDMKGHLRTNP